MSETHKHHPSLHEQNNSLLKEYIAIFPASFAQERIWFLDQLEPGTSRYNECIAFRLSGPLTIHFLQESLDMLVQRHEILRTSIGIVDGQVMQYIQETMHLPFTHQILETAKGQEQDDTIKEITQSFLQQPFNLSTGPLLRACLLTLNTDQHVVILAVHHSIFDGWSSDILLHELTTLYHSLVNGQQSTLLPELMIQYADYAVWQRQWLQGKRRENLLHYWQNKLTDMPTQLALSTDYPLSTLRSDKGAVHKFILSKSLLDASQAVCIQHRITMHMLLSAVFSILLHQFSNQEDIVIGTPVAGRNRKELEHLIGLFINTLVVRIQLTGKLTVRELLAHVCQTAKEDYAHQELPFEQLVEALQPKRDVNQTPLFQVMFLYQQNILETLQLDDLLIEPLIIESQTAKFALSLKLAQSSEGLKGFFEYSCDLFLPSTISRLAEHFHLLLASIVANQEQPLELLPLLTAQEEAQIERWNATHIPYPATSTLPALIEAQVQRSPLAPAVRDETHSLSYQQLNRASNRLATRLRHLGVAPEVPVGLFAQRSVDLLVGLLAILKAGGTFVPLDPSSPPQRLASILQDAHLSIVLCQQGLLASLTPPDDMTFLLLDRVHEAGQEETWEHNLPSGLLPLHPAYLIYTSGSTGQPKGVLTTHAGICNRLLWMQEQYALTPQDRVLQKTPYTFDVSVWEFFWPLLSGACLVMARPGGHQESDYLTQFIIEQQITTLHFVPSMLSIFLQEPMADRCTSLRLLLCSGEALSMQTMQRCLHTLPGVQLHNLYGPTEAAIDVTSWHCLPSWHTTVPIGRPIANTRIEILNTLSQRVAPGMIGEIYLGGCNLARGYHQRADLTAERFVPDACSGREGERLYRTGDLGRYHADGSIEYLGRCDYQVKLRGQRIELGEIEVHLQQHAQVRDAVVLLREDQESEQRLVAYLLGRTGMGSGPSHDELRTYLQQSLPEYMVPTAFVELEAFPLTSSGKCDRKALPIPDTYATIRNTFQPPTTELEQEIAHIWSQLLHIEHIGIHDNFFELGGHSLLATQMMARLRTRFQVNMPLHSLFEQPTIAGITSACELYRQEQDTEVISPITRINRDRYRKKRAEIFYKD